MEGMVQAIILAAGKGTRLGDLTENNTKCMVSVAGVKLIDRAVSAITKAGIKKIIIVVGYKGDNLKRYINDKYKNSKIDFIFVKNKIFEVTNNIYSLYLAKDYLSAEDTILLESDLVYDEKIVQQMVETKYANSAAVADYQTWMDGTIITCSNGIIDNFYSKDELDYEHSHRYYKTVNIYKLSKEFSQKTYIPFLKTYIDVCGCNSYYESVLKTILTIPYVEIQAYNIKELEWYEIDDKQDLAIANVIFSKGEEKYRLLTSTYGGFWRYSRVKDFLYLVNPYFPPAQLIEKMKYEFKNLLEMYPSGMQIQKLNAERIFAVDGDMLLVGNGAAELIKILGEKFNNLQGVAFVPTFNEYIRCFNIDKMMIIDNSKNNYEYNIEQILLLIESVEYMVIISPDNPSGAMIKEEDIMAIIKKGADYNCKIIIDESFIDFAARDSYFTLLKNGILLNYTNLIVIKSISKSYGVPGLRLGVMASGDKKLIKEMQGMLPVWNINSFAEYYLQNYNIFKKTYESACIKIVNERERVEKTLSKNKNIKLYQSNANYIMFDLKEHDSNKFCYTMLEKYNILIKNLKGKDGIGKKNFVRIAIRDVDDNNLLLDSITRYFNDNGE